MEHKQWEYGEYVFTPCKNVENNKTSYWISKKYHTLACYYGTPWDNATLKEMQTKEYMESYIRFYEERLSKAYRNNVKPVKTEDKYEFIGQIMDVFEEFLGQHNVRFPETIGMMREAGCSEEEIKENNVVLYGDNYSAISDEIETILVNWGVCNS